LGKICWLRRGVRWRLTCASKCLVIMKKKKKSVPVIFEPPCKRVELLQEPASEWHEEIHYQHDENNTSKTTITVHTYFNYNTSYSCGPA
jgi:hypothetical protein